MIAQYFDEGEVELPLVRVGDEGATMKTRSWCPRCQAPFRLDPPGALCVACDSVLQESPAPTPYDLEALELLGVGILGCGELTPEEAAEPVDFWHALNGRGRAIVRELAARLERAAGEDRALPCVGASDST